VLYLGDPVAKLGIEVQTGEDRKELFELRSEVYVGRGPFITRRSEVRILSPLLDKKEPPTDDVERFLAMLRFDSREKLKGFQLDLGK
jgi:hypothetical protein